MIRNTGWIWSGFSGGNHSEQRKKGNIKGMQPLLQESHIKKCRLCSLTADAYFFDRKCISALCGGSPLDAIKAIAVLLVCGGKLSDYMGKEISGDFPPMAAIPTTAGTI